MKYFTSELLARYRSSDESVAEAAAQEWEQAINAYQARFRSVRRSLPRRVRRLCAKFSLHDARVIGLAWRERKPLIGMLLQLEGANGDRGEFLEVRYHSVVGPTGGIGIKTPVATEGTQHRDAGILYDEFDLNEEHAFFTHSLLLTDGRELEIRFHNLIVRRLGQVYTPPELTQREVKWPLIESVA